jgi:phosphoribosylglycinamide formyltransferase-1
MRSLRTPARRGRRRIFRPPAAAALQRVSANLRWAHAPKEFQDRAAYEQALGDALAAVAPD